MKLKSLTINGFKSFADKTEINFQPGITGIVGPNGSGKSNIIEALRWVLGEQSAKSLRGNRMPDVIFAGSATRAPLNRAEVSIEFDNSDHFLKDQPSELSITRRIYRSGESEFLLNNKKVRLKDIVNLFMDTGLGKESFSVISQGRVESIFNSKPEERRVLIEETAGILKYKKEKERAQKELAQTTDHLDRVTDILTELKRQREPLEQQASIARDYLEQKKQYDYYYLNRLVLEIKKGQIEKQQIDSKLQSVKELLVKYKKDALDQEDTTQKLHAEQKAVETQLDEYQEQFVTLTKQKERLASQKDISEQQKSFQLEKKSKLEKQLSANREELVRITKELTQVNDKVLKLSAQKDKLQIKIDQLRENQQLAPEELEFELREINQKITTKTQQKLQVESELSFLKQNLNKNSEKLDKIKAQQQQLLSDKEHLAHELNAENEKLTQLNAQINDKEQLDVEYQGLKDQYDHQLDTQRQNWYQASRILQKAKARYEALQSVNTSYSGYYAGVREILKNKKQFNGVLGSVAELLDVDDQYALSIETALGTQLQNVVVKDEQVAKKCIQFLTKKRLGRATFLPKTTIKPRYADAKLVDAVKKMDGFIGIGSDLVHSDSQNQSIVQYLLGTILIVDNLDHATKIAGRINHRLKIVTLDGSVMNPGGSMSGGANHNQQNGLLKKRQELQQLEGQLQVMQQKLSQSENDGQRLKLKLAEIAKKAQDNSDALKKQFELQKTIKTKVDEIDLKIEHVDHQLENYQNQIDELSMDKQNQRQQSLQAQLVQLTKDLEILHSELDVKREFSDNQQVLQKESTTKLNDLQTKILEITEELSSIKVHQNELMMQENQLNKGIKNAENQLKEIEEQHSENQLQGSELKEKQEKIASEYEKLKAELTILQQRRSKLHDEVNQAELGLKRVNELQQTTYDEQQKLALQSGKITTKLEQHLTSLTETYQLSFEKAEEQATEKDLDDVLKHLRLLKLGIDELGEVNLGAIDEFERVNERFEFLNDQQNDLNAAKETLLQSMDEMDSEVKTRFKQTFDEVSAAFSELFPQIFGGGKAHLTLTNPDNLLTTGIEITAQPPGKKAQILSLLSGGERSLTAITLLFALLKVRPVPFAVLDEAEAALDDANVARYSQYLRNFDDETQFIVITHRKGTMMQADILYGVTMQESGVSKMVSVALTDVI